MEEPDGEGKELRIYMEMQGAGMPGLQIGRLIGMIMQKRSILGASTMWKAQTSRTMRSWCRGFEGMEGVKGRRNRRLLPLRAQELWEGFVPCAQKVHFHGPKKIGIEISRIGSLLRRRVSTQDQLEGHRIREQLFVLSVPTRG